MILTRSYPADFEPDVYASSLANAINVLAMKDLSELNSESFSAHLQTDFNVTFEGGPPVTLRLIEVNKPSTPPNIELFSLIFSGPPAPRLPQRTHHVQHEKMGSFVLFLTAVAGDAESISYEAVFHRMRAKKP